MFTIEFTVREAGKTETVTGAEYRTEKAAKKAAENYTKWGKATGKPPTLRVIPVERIAA